MAHNKKSKNNSDKPRAAAAIRELEAVINQNTSCDELAVLKTSLTNLIALAEDRIAELKRQRIEAIDAEIAQLNHERESLK